VTGADIAVVITSLATLIGVAGSVWVQLRGQDEARASRVALSKQMVKVEQATDGISERLAETKLAQGTAEGHALGLEQGRNEPK
jgi:flagellar biosynthesis/type III secretory pathway protein FliH